jgi:hypothetical protein
MAQVRDNLVKKRTAHHQFAHHTPLRGDWCGPLVSRLGAIASGHSGTPTQGDLRLNQPTVARHLAGDGGARPLESGGYSRRTPTQYQLRLKQSPFRQRQLLIRLPHATLSLLDVLHLDFERGQLDSEGKE